MANARRKDTTSLSLVFEKDDGPVSKWANKSMERTERKLAREKKKAEDEASGKEPKPKVMAAALFNRAMLDVKEMAESGDWEECAARHLVALYAYLHERIYGVEATDLNPRQRHLSCLQVGSFAKNYFGGNFFHVVEYMKWVWNREAGREAWRRENHRQGNRIGVRLMFAGTLVADYRLAMARGG